MDTLMGSLSDIRLQFIQNKDIRFLYARYADAGASITLYDENGNSLLSVPEASPASASPGSYKVFQDTVITIPLTRTGWSLTGRIPFSVFLQGSLPLLLTAGSIFLVAIFMAVLLSSVAGRRLLNPFQEITAQMEPINSWGDRQALFTEEGIRIKGLRESFLDAAGCPTQPKAREDRILSCHEGHRYALRVAGGTVAAKDGGFLILSQEEEFTLFPENI